MTETPGNFHVGARVRGAGEVLLGGSGKIERMFGVFRLPGCLVVNIYPILDRA